MTAIAIPHRLRFFIVRPEVATQTPTGAPHKQLGPIVPLIPADELPEWLEVVGAPSELTIEQAMTLTNLGTVAKNYVPWEIRIAHDAPQQKQQAIESWADDVPGTLPPVHPADKMKAHWNEPQRPGGLNNSIHNHPADGNPGTGTTYHTRPSSPPVTVPVAVSHHPAPAPAPPTTVPVAVPHHTASPQDQKSDEYCRHWCHHGNCKWGNQCKFQHSMPTTAQGLMDVGLREFPAWYLGTHHHHHAPQAQHQQPPPLQQEFFNFPRFTAPAARLAAMRHPGFLSPASPPAPAPIRNVNNNNPGGMGMGMGMNTGTGPGMGYPPHSQHHQQQQQQPLLQQFHGMFPPGLLDGIVAQPMSNKQLKRFLREHIEFAKRMGLTTGPTGPIMHRMVELVQQRRKELMIGGGGGVEEDRGKQQWEGVKGEGAEVEAAGVVVRSAAAAGVPKTVPVEEVSLLD